MHFKKDNVYHVYNQGNNRKLLSSYARVFNSQNNRTGSLFRQKTKAKSLTDEEDSGSAVVRNDQDYCINCFQYIHENPVLARLVKHPRDWKWSSYGLYERNEKSEFCNIELAKKYCGYSENDFDKRRDLSQFDTIVE